MGMTTISPTVVPVSSSKTVVKYVMEVKNIAEENDAVKKRIPWR